MKFTGTTTRARLLVLAMAPGLVLLAQPAAASAGVTHGVMMRDFNSTTSTSTNWSGYDTTSGPFTSVSSSWVQPAVNCSLSAKRSYSSFWVGLDGDGSNTVEQTGTDSDCVRGHAVYYGWYEMYPAAPSNFTNPVAPGDVLSASVTTDGSGAFTLTLNDQTQGWTQVTQKSLASAQRYSAEVIAEAPSTGKVLPLADFGTVNFTSSVVDGTAIGNLNPDEITMASGSNVKAQPGPLSSGENFSVTWKSS
jgi:hypothetical protein